ncbi:MAG: M56 family metallopeptidase [Candidatus Aminicenantales bacterium]
MSWADFRCSWQCLGSRVSAFIIREGIWIIIFAFLFLVLLRALLRVGRRLKETSTFNERLMMIASPRRSWGIDYFIFPFLLPLALTAGLIKPKIFLSSTLLKVLTQEELKTVLLHEAFHQKKRHPLKNLIVSFLADLGFFLPATKRLREAFGLAGELRADFHGLDKGQDLSSLLSSLRKIHNYRVGPELGLSLYSPVQFNDLERLRYLSEGGLKFSWSWPQLVISFLVVVLAFFLTLAPFGEGGKKLILEHKSTCAFHTLIKERSEL